MGQRDETARDIINGAWGEVRGRETGTTVMYAMAEHSKELEEQEREQVEAYIASLRPVVAGVLFEQKPGDIAGECDTSGVTLATSLPSVDTRDVDSQAASVAARVRETLEHEKYHQHHKHAHGIAMPEDGKVVIGGIEIKDGSTGVIEPLTMDATATGAIEYSATYNKYVTTLDTALSNAGLTMDDVAVAVNEKHSLVALDDRERAEKGAETNLQLAV